MILLLEVIELQDDPLAYRIFLRNLFSHTFHHRGIFLNLFAASFLDILDFSDDFFLELSFFVFKLTETFTD